MAEKKLSPALFTVRFSIFFSKKTVVSQKSKIQRWGQKALQKEGAGSI